MRVSSSVSSSTLLSLVRLLVHHNVWYLCTRNTIWQTIRKGDVVLSAAVSYEHAM